ncbi:MAG: M3 family peptidase, partial [Bacteroidales bacterium]|nr:M3 family peptidase [Bacteroidales bacterium]
MDINPLLQEWTTPYQTPPFHLFRNEHYAPAVRDAIKTAEDNIKAIAGQQEAPTFENTIERLETASDMLDRVTALLLNLNECNTNPQMQSIVLELMPEITRFEN